MVVFGGLLDLVIVVFLVLVFAEYAKVRAKAEKAFKLVAASGVILLLAYSFSGLSVWGLITGAAYGTMVFEIIGWILLLVGTLWATMSLAKK